MTTQENMCVNRHHQALVAAPARRTDLEAPSNPFFSEVWLVGSCSGKRHPFAWRGPGVSYPPMFSPPRRTSLMSASRCRTTGPTACGTGRKATKTTELCTAIQTRIPSRSTHRTRHGDVRIEGCGILEISHSCISRGQAERARSSTGTYEWCC